MYDLCCNVIVLFLIASIVSAVYGIKKYLDDKEVDMLVCHILVSIDLLYIVFAILVVIPNVKTYHFPPRYGYNLSNKQINLLAYTSCAMLLVNFIGVGIQRGLGYTRLY